MQVYLALGQEPWTGTERGDSEGIVTRGAAAHLIDRSGEGVLSEGSTGACCWTGGEKLVAKGSVGQPGGGSTKQLYLAQ
jgi:hypothetical protein